MTTAPAPVPPVGKTTAPDVAELFVAAVALRDFTGMVSVEQLRATLAASGVESRWLSGSPWALLSRLWRSRLNADDARRIISAEARHLA